MTLAERVDLIRRGLSCLPSPFREVALSNISLDYISRWGWDEEPVRTVGEALNLAFLWSTVKCPDPTMKWDKLAMMCSDTPIPEITVDPLPEPELVQPDFL